VYGDIYRTRLIISKKKKNGHPVPKTQQEIGHTAHNNTTSTHTQPRLINLTNTKFTKEQISTLALGPNYALEKDLKHYINELIIDTENAIRQLDPKVQNTFQYMVTTKVKQIMATSMHYTLHRRHQYNLNQIRKTL
jgi:hypothetical protein